MALLKESLSNGGFADVQTYIQSGNVILKATMDASMIEQKVTSNIKNDFGHIIPVLVKTSEEMRIILESNPFMDSSELKNLYVTLLHHNPPEKEVQDFQKLQFKNEDFYVTPACVYLNCKMGASRAKLNNTLIEKKLKVTATTRNLKTMKKMLELVNSYR